MAVNDDSPVSLATLIEAGGACTTPLDAAAEYWRLRFGRLLPVYILAMAPHALIANLLIAAISGEQRSLAAQYCLYLTVATLWRWVWLGRLQQRVQQDLGTPVAASFWSRIGQILLLRLLANFAMNWGAIIAGLPAFYGFFLSGFATPLLLESNDKPQVRVRQAISWIHHSGRRLFRIMLILTAFAVLLLVGLFASQYALANTVLPSFLNVDTADLELTLNGTAWRLSMIYFAWLILDAYWAVAAVLVFYDSQSRRSASDLRARLKVLTQGAT
jgi:hypothetical protein